MPLLSPRWWWAPCRSSCLLNLLLLTQHSLTLSYINTVCTCLSLVIAANSSSSLFNSTISFSNAYRMYTVEPVYYGHLGTDKKYPDYQGILIIQVSLYDKATFGTITKCVDNAGVLFSSVLINRFTVICIKHNILDFP